MKSDSGSTGETVQKIGEKGCVHVTIKQKTL